MITMSINPNFDSKGYRINPYAMYRSIRSHSPVCQIQPGNLWVVTNYKDVEFVLKRDDLFSSSGFKAICKPDWLSEDCHRDMFVLAADLPLHKIRRRTINKAFIPRIINQLTPLLHETAERLVNDLKSLNPIEFVHDFSYPYAGAAMARLTGTEDTQNIDSIFEWLRQTEKLSPVKPSDADILSIENEMRKQNDYLLDIIHDRKTNPRDDIVGELLNAEIDGQPLTDYQLRNILELFLTAGFHTVTHSLGMAMILFARQPEILQQLRKDQSLIPGFIEELLRFYPSAQSILRQTTNDVSFGDTTIPKGEVVLTIVASANRDETVFEDSDTFDMHRSNAKAHLGFGLGIHNCIGSGLARLELRVAFEHLVRAFSRVNCAPDEELPWIKSFLSRGVSSLRLQLTG
jgi:cytochrome P450